MKNNQTLVQVSATMQIPSSLHPVWEYFSLLSSSLGRETMIPQLTAIKAPNLFSFLATYFFNESRKTSLKKNYTDLFF